MNEQHNQPDTQIPDGPAPDSPAATTRVAEAEGCALAAVVIWTVVGGIVGLLIPLFWLIIGIVQRDADVVIFFTTSLYERFGIPLLLILGGGSLIGAVVAALLGTVIALWRTPSRS